MKLSLLLLPWAALLAAGCSSGNPSTSPEDGGHADSQHTTDANGGQDAGIDSATEAEAAAEAATVCNTLANTAPAVPVQTIAADPPASTGGTIADGTYWMTEVVIYTGPDGPSETSGTSQTTIQITGPTIQTVSAGDPPTTTVTLATSGTAFTSTDTCGDAMVRQGTYSATATTFVVQVPAGTDDAGARTLVETFTKQ
jgi:hypothetical protein